MLTEREAFEALRYFLAEFWKRGGSQGDSEFVDILSWIATDVWQDGGTADPTQWDDWMTAVRAIQSGGRAEPFEPQ